jgi:hypothetical protein
MNRLHPSQRERFWAPRGRVTGWICLGVGGFGGALVAMGLTGLGGFVGLGGAGGLGGRGGLGTGCFLGCRRRTSGCSWWLRARAVYCLCVARRWVAIVLKRADLIAGVSFAARPYH